MVDETFDVMKAIVVGNSVAVVIPQHIREKLAIEEGTYLKLRVEGKSIVLEIVK